MKIVFDTNVLLAGIFSRGLCEALLDACLGSEECTVALSEHILAEFARHAVDKFGAQSGEVGGAVEFLRSQVQMVQPAPVPAGSCPDADDLPVLGTALAAQADCLVTGDKELLKLRRFRGTAIISPRALFEQIQQQ